MQSSVNDVNLQFLLTELGHKMPFYCKSLLHPDHGILDHFQFSGRVLDDVDLDMLPVERVLSPFLVMVVCEKTYMERILYDSGRTPGSSDDCRSICNLYSQVLTDFDCLLSLLNGLTENLVPNQLGKDVPVSDSNSQPVTQEAPCSSRKSDVNCSSRLHRRTHHIIEDLCTLVFSSAQFVW